MSLSFCVTSQLISLELMIKTAVIIPVLLMKVMMTCRQILVHSVMVVICPLFLLVLSFCVIPLLNLCSRHNLVHIFLFLFLFCTYLLSNLSFLISLFLVSFLVLLTLICFFSVRILSPFFFLFLLFKFSISCLNFPLFLVFLNTKNFTNGLSIIYTPLEYKSIVSCHMPVH